MVHISWKVLVEKRLTVRGSGCLEGLVRRLCGGSGENGRLLSKHHNHDLDEPEQI